MHLLGRWGLEVESDNTTEYVMKFDVGVELPLVLWVLPQNKSLPTFPEFMPQNDGEAESAEEEEKCHDEPQSGEDVDDGLCVGKRQLVLDANCIEGDEHELQPTKGARV